MNQFAYAKPRGWVAGAVVGAMLFLAAAPAAAQFDLFGGNQQGAAAEAAPPVTVEAQFTVPQDGNPARLFVTAKVASGWHIYSTTQPPGGPVATRIQVEPSTAYKTYGDFQADREPHRKREPAFNNLAVETFENEVTWHVPLGFSEGTDPATLRIEGAVRAQPCNAGSCLPPTSYPFVARLGPGVKLPEPEPVSVSAEFTPPQAGEPARLYVTATMQPGWHIYSTTQPSGGPLATVIGLDPASPAQLAGPFQPDREPERKSEPAFNGMTVESFHDRVTWHAPLELAPDTDPTKLEIAGFLRAQPCQASGCLMPTRYPFTARLGTGVPIGPPQQPAGGSTQPVAPPDAGTSGSDDAPASFTANSAATAFDPGAVVVREGAQSEKVSAPVALLLAFMGGLILNLMPCVLPVIGLKILSFVEQSGHSRSQAFWLNLWYALGLISVFMVLAALAILLGLGWGQLFSFQGFNITLAAIVFAFGLSFLGVWEIPIPGFASSASANQLARKEGVAGAFAKGVLTTLLATPCSAPFLGTALAWTVGQPAPLTLAVFAAAGIGMASPYLLIGAFPELMRFVPKPGAWMDTFKQVMGFVLLGTVVYIFTFIPFPYVVPTLGLLIGIWAATWWIGRTSIYAELPVRLRAWAQGLTFAALVWVLMFPGVPGVFGGLIDVTRVRFERDAARLVDEQMAERVAVRPAAAERPAADAAVEATSATATQSGSHLNWQPFTRQKFDKLVSSGKTVLVDFTADWCLTCKTLETLYLNTAATREAVDAQGVVTLQADWTDGDPEVTAMLEALGSKQVPVIAIFPGGNPNAPVVLRGGYTQSSLLDALARATPQR